MNTVASGWSRSRVGVAAVVVLASLSYIVLWGGTLPSELLSGLRIVNAVVAGAAIIYYVVRGPDRADRLDRLVLGAVILFALAGVFSQHLRQSLDAVLAVLAWAAGLFVARDQAARPAVRRALGMVLMALSAIVTLTTAVRWLPVLLTWWSTTGILVPPLDLDYPGLPWGHWHDLALLVVVLYPAWWIGSPGILRRIAAVAIGLLVLAIVVVDGSRNVWLAIAAASLVVVAAHAVRRPALVRRLAVPAAALAAVTGVGLVLSGAGAAIIARASDLGPLGMRGAMWGAAIDAWWANPVAGVGPGSFPWILQRTGYFDTNSLAPRHPDSLLFQLLPEAGLLGIAAAVLVVAAVVPRMLRAQATTASWALLVLASAGVGANPTDFGFFIAVAIAWLAFVAPNANGASAEAVQRWRSPVTRSVVVGCVVIIAITQAMTLAAGVTYDRARDHVARGRLADALPALGASVSLDPGLGLYARQRGILRLLLDDAGNAVQDLRVATERNPADDLAWRALALVQRASGDHDAAADSLDQAIQLQRSDPTNLLLRAHWHTIDGEDHEAATILAEIVHAWPAITAAPAWEAVRPDGVGTLQIIDAALERWAQDRPSPEPQGGQGVWLALHADRSDLLPAAMGESSTSTRFDDMILATFTCDPGATDMLETASTNERQTFLYWLLRVRASSIDGRPDADTRRVIGIWGGGALRPANALATLNPLHDNDPNGFSADRWGYRRLPINWPPVDPELPSPWTGAARWLIDPIEATKVAGLQERLPLCRS